MAFPARRPTPVEVPPLSATKKSGKRHPVHLLHKSFRSICGSSGATRLKNQEKRGWDQHPTPAPAEKSKYIFVRYRIQNATPGSQIFPLPTSNDVGTNPVLCCDASHTWLESGDICSKNFLGSCRDLEGGKAARRVPGWSRLTDSDEGTNGTEPRTLFSPPFRRRGIAATERRSAGSPHQVRRWRGWGRSGRSIAKCGLCLGGQLGGCPNTTQARRAWPGTRMTGPAMPQNVISAKTRLHSAIPATVAK